MLSALMRDAVRVDGPHMTLNYGLNRVRFVSPVPSGSRIRARIALRRLDHMGDSIQATWNITVEREETEAEDRVVARYVGGNPNGSMRDIAGIRNEAGNVVGIMPHPEHAVEELTGPSLDGLGFFASVLKHLAGAGGQGSQLPGDHVRSGPVGAAPRPP